MTDVAGNQAPPKAKASIFANFRAIFVGRLVYALSAWSALIILAHLSDPETVGLYALAQATCIPIAQVLMMGLREVRASDVKDEIPFGTYAQLRLICMAIALALMLAAGFLFAGGEFAILVIMVFGVSRCVEMISDIIYGHFQTEERMAHIGWSLSVVGVLSLLFLGVGFAATGSLLTAVLGQLLAFIGVFLFYDAPKAWRLGGHWLSKADLITFDGGKIKELARIAMPLALANALLMVSLYAPRLMVESILGVAALGIFAPLLALAMAPDRLVHALGVSLSVRLAHIYFHQPRVEYARAIGAFAVAIASFGAVAILVAWVAGEYVIGLVYPDTYIEYVDLFVLLTIAMALRLLANVFKLALIAARRFWWLTLRSAITAASAVPVCWFFIPNFGLTGAAWAMITIFGVQLATSVVGIGWAFRQDNEGAH